MYMQLGCTNRSLPRTQLLLLLPRRLSPVEVDGRAHLYHVLIISAFRAILASCVCLFSSSFLMFAEKAESRNTEPLIFNFFFNYLLFLPGVGHPLIIGAKHLTLCVRTVQLSIPWDRNFSKFQSIVTQSFLGYIRKLNM